MENIFEQVRQIVADKLKVDESSITMESNFTTDLGADSLDLTELVMDIEERFKIQISDETMKHIATVGDVVSHLETVLK